MKRIMDIAYQLDFHRANVSNFVQTTAHYIKNQMNTPSTRNKHTSTITFLAFQIITEFRLLRNIIQMYNIMRIFIIKISRFSSSFLLPGGFNLKKKIDNRYVYLK